MTAADVYDVDETHLDEGTRPSRQEDAVGAMTPLDPRRTMAPNPAAGRATADVAVITGLALALWVAVLFLGRIWGMLLDLQGRKLVLFTPPLLGAYREVFTPALLLPVPVAVGAVIVLPRLSRRLRWEAVCGAGALSALVWGVVLAVIDGNEGLISGLEWNAEYGPAVAQMRTGGIAHWLSGFTASVPTAGIQIRAHPPGMPLVLTALDHLGMEGPWWAAAFILTVALSAVVAVLIAGRELGGEDAARRAMPFVALAPAVVFVFTSYDALYMGVSAWFVTVLVLATRRTGRAADRLAVLAGVLAAAAVMGSYGMVLMGLVPVAVAAVTRAWRAVVIAGATAFACVLAFVPFGFWWMSGLGAT